MTLDQIKETVQSIPHIGQILAATMVLGITIYKEMQVNIRMSIPIAKVLTEYFRILSIRMPKKRHSQRTQTLFSRLLEDAGRSCQRLIQGNSKD